MPRYRVTLCLTTTEIVTADNPYQAAIVAAAQHGGSVEVSDVRPAVGRPTTSTPTRKATKSAKKPVKKVVKKRRPMSPEARARLGQNLVKARAARARNRKAATKATKTSAKRVTKKRRRNGDA